jgi:hypothetical protein
MRLPLMLLFLFIGVYSQQLVNNTVISYSEYDDAMYNIRVIPSPITLDHNTMSRNAQYVVKVAHKKNTNQHDLFSFAGVIGSFIVDPKEFPLDQYDIVVYVSQTIINSDQNWEYIINYTKKEDYYRESQMFKVADYKGNIILADSGIASYGYDGKSTYVFVNKSDATYFSYKTWRFRTDAAMFTQSLAKTVNTTTAPMMSLMPTGDFRVALQPTTNGETSIQIFDMLGKQIFSQTIQNINSPKSFIVPSSGIPRSPFIAKVKSGDETFTKKEIPIR